MILAEEPDHLEALANKAFALREAGEIDAALQVYGRLMHLDPQNSVWTRWLQVLRKERHPGAARATESRERKRHEGSPQEGVLRGGAVFVPAERSWSGFAAEFVKEHWQKLILSLAVLLIVVSSTVGAHLLLGDLLWSPEGKCTLALAGTLLLAALGTGLEHWGAGRAGRMMLITTLIVVPIHFMLAGELKLLFQPPSLRTLFLVAIAVVLVCLVRWASGRLAEPQGRLAVDGVAALDQPGKRCHHARLFGRRRPSIRLLPAGAGRIPGHGLRNGQSAVGFFPG